MKVSKEGLLNILQDMIETIKADDSFEGSLSYTVMDDDLGPGEFEVGAFYRFGNSMGQGGAVVIEAKQPVMDEEDAAKAHRVA